MPLLCARAIRHSILALILLHGVSVQSNDSFLAWSVRSERLSQRDFEKYLPVGVRVRLDTHGFSVLEKSKPWSNWDLKRISYAPGVKGQARSEAVIWDFGPALPGETEVRQKIITFEQKRWEQYFSNRSLASSAPDQRRVVILPQSAKEAWSNVLSAEGFSPFQWRDPPSAQGTEALGLHFVETHPSWVQSLASRNAVGTLVAFGIPSQIKTNEKISESAWIYASLWRACKEVPTPSPDLRRILLPVRTLDRHSELILKELIQLRCRMEHLGNPDAGRSTASH